VSDDSKGDSSGSQFSEVGNCSGFLRLSHESVTGGSDSRSGFAFILTILSVRKSLYRFPIASNVFPYKA